MSDNKALRRPRPQGRVYAAIIGVVVGMLAAGLGVPLAFGRISDSGTERSGLSPATGGVPLASTEAQSSPPSAGATGPVALPTFGPGAATTGDSTTHGATGAGGSVTGSGG